MTAGADADAFTFTAELWLHPGPAGWHFLTLPPALADEVSDRTAAAARAFGSVPVRVTIGSSSWSTSLFPDARSASYLLPVKAAIRRRERLGSGDAVRATIRPSSGGGA